MMNTYASWYTEIHPYEIGFEVSSKIASHLVTRISEGNAIIVCDAPSKWAATFQKRWQEVLVILGKERAMLPGTKAKEEFRLFLDKVGITRFRASEPQESYTPQVWLVKPDNFNVVPKGVGTIYVMGAIGMEQLLFWTRQMEDGGVVVVFRRESLTRVLEGP